MDRRVEKTKSAIKHEVINSLNTNEIEKITVKSICDKININRSTFYLHYSTINDVIDESDYEDEYSHNNIEEAQGLFIEKVKNYLHNNHPNKYVVSSGWCVFIMTPERARQSNISEKTIELFTVK